MTKHICGLTFVVVISFFAGCAAAETVKHDENRLEDKNIVQSGDTVDINYLCKLKTGEAVASTEKLADNQPKSSIFVLAQPAVPVPVTAGSPFPKLAAGKELLIEDEIKYRLADIVTGMKEGEIRIVELSAEDVDTRTEGNYVVHLARVRKRPKEMRIPIDAYKDRLGHPAEVGQVFIYDPAIPGRVDAVGDKEVIVRFSAKTGDIVRTPFGLGRVRETEKEYEIVIDATVGSLIRTARLVGRVTAVDDKNITVDYRNPFGREPLTCDVKVEKFEARKGDGEKKKTEAKNNQATETQSR